MFQFFFATSTSVLVQGTALMLIHGSPEICCSPPKRYGSALSRYKLISLTSKVTSGGLAYVQFIIARTLDNAQKFLLENGYYKAGPSDGGYVPKSSRFGITIKVTSL